MSYTPHASYVRVNNEKEYICYNTCFKLVKNLLKPNFCSITNVLYKENGNETSSPTKKRHRKNTPALKKES